MDPQKKPFSSSNEPSDAADTASDTPETTPMDGQNDAGMGGDSTEPMSDAPTDAGDEPMSDAGMSDSPAAPEASDASDVPPAADASASDAPAAPETPAAPMADTAPAADVTPDAPASASAGTVMPSGAGTPSSMPDTAPASVMPTVMGGPKRGKKPMLIGIIVAAIVVILLGASAAAYYVVINKPQNVLNIALSNTFSTSKVSSLSFDGSLGIKPKGSNSLTTTFTGAADDKGAFTFTGKLDALVTTITLDARTADGGTYYARVGGLNGLPELLQATGDPSAAMYAPILAGLNNQWIQINQGMIKQITGSDTTISTKLSDNDRKKLEDAYKKDKFLVAQKSLPAESIKGKNSYHFQVTVDKTKLKAFAAAVKAANISNMTITQDSLTSFNKSVDQANFSKYPVDVWVAKGSRLIDQVSLTTVQDGTTVSFRLTADDYNKPVNVVVPSGAHSLLDVLSNLLTSSLGGSSSSLDALGGISL